MGCLSYSGVQPVTLEDNARPVAGVNATIKFGIMAPSIFDASFGD
jgi:hypothetical protein